jgi:signal transduction histidine kinase
VVYGLPRQEVQMSTEANESAKTNESAEASAAVEAGRTGRRRFWDPLARGRDALDALDHLAGGLGTAVLAVCALIGLVVTAPLCVVGVGLMLAPGALRMVRWVADRERIRLSRWGPEIIGAAPVPDRLADAVRDAAVRRELGWTVCHAVIGLLFGLLTLSLPIYVLENLTFPLWWQAVHGAPPGLDIFTVHDLAGALVVSTLGLAELLVMVLALPLLAAGQTRLGYALLAPDRDTDLVLRLAELKATRAAALDAHAAELRRIERSLHDGTQNRLVAVTVLIGAANRALARDPDDAKEILARAQDAAENALAELRGVVRSILPPVLTERSLPDALTGLAADCPVPCQIDANVTDRFAASVEATVYFVVAEALTNIAKHSGAHRAIVTLRRADDRLWVDVTDDGHGGAEAAGGSGLIGIRRRVEAHDGTFALSSPAGGPTVLTVSVPCGS